MKGEYGTLFVQATSAANGRDGVTFSTFTASPVLMEGEGPVTGSVNSKQFTVTHIGDSAISVDDYVLVVKTMQGFFVTVPGGGAGSIIEFTILEDDYAEAGSGECADASSGIESITASVTSRPCGVDRVPLEDDNGNVVIHDRAAGGFLVGRSAADLSGKGGFATLLESESGYNCEWVITWMNWFVEIQDVTDVVIAGNSITIERKNVKVWSECDLPPEVIEGTDCAETTY